MAMTACLNNDKMTVVLPTGTVSHNVIPDEIRDVLTDHIPVYEGNEIPNISGYFLADNVVSLYCSDEGSGGYSPGDSFADEYFYFGEITSRGLIYEYMEREGSTYFSSNLVQVMGDGNNFTAYYVTESNRDVDKDGTNETWSKISTILSGTIPIMRYASDKYPFGNDYSRWYYELEESHHHGGQNRPAEQVNGCKCLSCV